MPLAALQAPSESRPFFIVGCGRSGSTLLQTLLDAHPNLTLPPETLLYTRFGKAARFYGDLAIATNRRRLISDVLDDFYFRAWDVDISTAEVEQLVVTPTRGGVFEALFRAYTTRKGAKRWGDKSPPHVHCLSMIKEDFPRAQLIHLVRDGRDTAEAWQRMLFGPVSMLGIGRMWQRDIAAWRDYRAAMDRGDMLEVRYEDLVTVPQDVVRRILDFLGEPVIDTVRTYSESDLSRSYSSVSWHSSLQSGISTGKIGIYRKRCSRRDIELFEYAAGSALVACGYSPEFEEPAAPRIHERLHAFIADRVVRWYRKLFHPAVVAGDVRFRYRMLSRRIGAWFNLPLQGAGDAPSK